MSRGARAGVIEEVVADDPPRFWVRWDDGNLTLFAPSPGGATIQPRSEDD